MHMLRPMLRAAALALLGLFAGGVYFVVIAPSLGRLPGDAYVRYWQALNLDYGQAMPPLLLTCMGLILATAILSARARACSRSETTPPSAGTGPYLRSRCWPSSVCSWRRLSMASARTT